MGADYAGQDSAIRELEALSEGAKMCLCHHIGNSLMQIIGGIETGRQEIATDAAWHIDADLKLFGIKK